MRGLVPAARPRACSAFPCALLWRVVVPLALLAPVTVASGAGPAGAAVERDELIGEVYEEALAPDTTLPDLARRHGLGFVQLRQANPDLDPWLPDPARLVLLPAQHVLPAAPRSGIVINLPELRLYYYGASYGTEPLRPLSFPISIGDEGLDTRLGETRVLRKASRPSWTPTASERAENPDLPRTVPPGPDNPMGDFALYLGWPGYAIHGTSRPYSIGRRGSHGCIRMYPEDIDLLYRLVEPGTPVRVVEQVAKLGWRGQELFLEVHAEMSDLNSIEAKGHRLAPSAYDAVEMVRKAAGDAADRVDWDAVWLAGIERRGVPVRITRPLVLDAHQ